MKTVSDDFESIGDWTAQPPINGIAYGGGEGGPFDVLWSNGTLVTGVSSGALDEIQSASEESLKLFGKTVTVGDSSSANYESVVVGVFNRATDDVAVLKSVTTGVYREVLVSQVIVVKGH